MIQSFPLLLFLILFVLTSSDPSHLDPMNVGTVLFTESDSSKRCWSNEQLALLRSRMIFQDILPKMNVVSMADDRFITALINYFRLTVERVKSMTIGKTKQINLMALTDAIGGYLRHLILPLAKHAFYSGTINYESTEHLAELYDELKAFLRTDGQNWTPPRKNFDKFKRQIQPLPDVLGNEHNGDPCSGLLFTERPNGDISIPIPFFDSKHEPNSIAVPFKTYPLRSLRSKSGAFVLVKYYMTATKCLTSKKANKESVDRFNNEFNSFLDENVMKHLDDEKLYPAFGSIYRIKESLNKATGIKGDYKYKNYGPKIKNLPATKEEPVSKDKYSLVLFASIGSVVGLWIIITIIYCLLRSKRKSKMGKKALGSPRKSITNTKSSQSKRFSGGKNKKQKIKDLQASDHQDEDKELNRRDSGKSEQKSVCFAKTGLNQSGQCPRCKRAKCAHGSTTTTTNFMMNVASFFKTPAKVVKSAPVSGKKAPNFFQESKSNISSSTTSASIGNEKPVVFGYDFDTSSSESSTIETSSASSSPRNSVKFTK